METFGLLRTYDNGGRTFDRYLAVFSDGGALGIGSTGNVPNGFCMHIAPEEYVEGDHLGELVEYESLPEPVQAAIVNEQHLHESIMRGEL